jgi:hypothetical protein
MKNPTCEPVDESSNGSRWMTQMLPINTLAIPYLE